jgi:hypothetical protein
MKTKKIIMLILAIFIIALLITNPSQKSHVTAATHSAEQIFGKQLVDSLQNDLLGNIKGVLGESGLESIKDLFGQENVSKAEQYVQNLHPTMSELITRKNYYLFSLTRAEVAGISQTIGIGILGSVYILV